MHAKHYIHNTEKYMIRLLINMYYEHCTTDHSLKTDNKKLNNYRWIEEKVIILILAENKEEKDAKLDRNFKNVVDTHCSSTTQKVGQFTENWLRAVLLGLETCLGLETVWRPIWQVLVLVLRAEVLVFVLERLGLEYFKTIYLFIRISHTLLIN